MEKLLKKLDDLTQKILNGNLSKSEMEDAIKEYQSVKESLEKNGVRFLDGLNVNTLIMPE